MKIATFIALLHVLCGHNTLNLTVITVYLLAAVTCMFLEELMVNHAVCSSGTINSRISVPYIDIECVSICSFVGI